MTSSPFLDLPREIRDLIYGWVFPPKGKHVRPADRGLWMTVNLEDDGHPTRFRLDRGFLIFGEEATSSKSKIFMIPFARNLLELTLVNHQISAESVAYFYSTITFSGAPRLNSNLSNFLKGIGPSRRSFIRTIQLKERWGDHLPLRFWELRLALYSRQLTESHDRNNPHEHGDRAGGTHSRRHT